MKFQLFAILLVVVGTYARSPASEVVVVDSVEQPALSSNQPEPRFIIVSQIRQAIRRISTEIKKAGLDPLEIEREEVVINPIPLFVEVEAFVENLRFTGASDIKIHSLSFNAFLTRLSFDISLPQISLTVGDSGIEGSVYNNKVEGQFKGSLVINSIRLSGNIRVNISIISGISLRSVSLNFRLGGIESSLTVSAQQIDFSEYLNTLLCESIPNALEDNRAEINKMLEDIVRAVFDSIL